MPFFLRLPCFLLMLAFEWSSLPGYAKSFSAMNLGDRRQHIQAVERWPVLRFNDLLKLTRSLLLLNYYDQPAVRRALGYDWPTAMIGEFE